MNFSDSFNLVDFLNEIPLLNWACMASYLTTAAALSLQTSRLWAHLTGAFLITAINNNVVAFTGWDYSATQAFAGTFLFTLPILPTLVLPTYRKIILAQKSIKQGLAAPRVNKRWRVEILSQGQSVPVTGITINVSDSGALVHLLKQSTEQQLFDMRLSEPNKGLILDCKARRVRDAVLPGTGHDIPVVGVEFLSLSAEQKEALSQSLHDK